MPNVRFPPISDISEVMPTVRFFSLSPWGEGWGEGVRRWGLFATVGLALLAPSPNPLPTRERA